MRKVWTAPLGFAGNCRIVGALDEIGLGKRREPSIATITKFKMWEVCPRLSNDFCNARERLQRFLDVTDDAEINDITWRI